MGGAKRVCHYGKKNIFDVVKKILMATIAEGGGRKALVAGTLRKERGFPYLSLVKEI